MMEKALRIGGYSARPRRSVPAAEAKEALASALAHRDHARALSVLAQLEELESADPRWPHKCGDVQRQLERPHEAAAAYRRAAERYAAQGFDRRSDAMRRLARSRAGQSARLVPLHPSLRP